MPDSVIAKIVSTVAEKTFCDIRKVAGKNENINFVAISHSDEQSTENWVTAVGGAWDVEVIVDDKRELYGQWGLGTSSLWHVLNPWSLYNVYNLGKAEKIWNKPTESGSRWQTSGSFAVLADGVVAWASVANAADEIPDFNAALKVIENDV